MTNRMDTRTRSFARNLLGVLGATFMVFVVAVIILMKYVGYIPAR